MNATERVIAMPGIATLTYQAPALDQLIMRGDLNGHPITLSLTRHNLEDFRVRRSGFHWVQESLPRD